MLEFAHLWMFALLPVPLLIWWLVPAYKEPRSAIRVPFFDELVARGGQTPQRGAVVLRRSLIQRVGLPIVWALVVVTLARPQWVEEPITKIQAARDLMLAVDLSGSMEATDFEDADGNRIQRLDAVKGVLDDFMSRREGDRLGLIFFGSDAFLQVPFTQDHDTCRALLDEARVRMAGPQTMIGDAIGLAIKRFEQSEVDNRVLILLTDGNDTGSKIPPARAAEIAAGKGVTIHTVAVGDPETVGEQKLDEAVLKEIARVTDGRFFSANDRGQLEGIYRELDQLEAREFETLSHRPTRPLFHWPLGAAVVLLIGYHAATAALAHLRRRAGHA
jgi:Ca-activated chloride channel family protein